MAELQANPDDIKPIAIAVAQVEAEEVLEETVAAETTESAELVAPSEPQPPGQSDLSNEGGPAVPNQLMRPVTPLHRMSLNRQLLPLADPISLWLRKETSRKKSSTSSHLSSPLNQTGSRLLRSSPRKSPLRQPGNSPSPEA